MDTKKISETVSDTVVTAAVKTELVAKSVADVASDVIDFTKAVGAGIRDGITKISE